MPLLAASALIESVLAVRQPLSAPTWENPTTSFLSAAKVAVTVPTSNADRPSRLIERLNTLIFFIFLGNCFRSTPLRERRNTTNPNTFFPGKINIYFSKAHECKDLIHFAKKTELNALDGNAKQEFRSLGTTGVQELQETQLS